MTTPSSLCPCGRPAARPGDPCILCQVKVLRALARGCLSLADQSERVQKRAKLDAIKLMR